MRRTFDALGTHWSVDIDGSGDKALFDELLAIVHAFQTDYSRFDACSYVGRLNDEKVLYDAPNELVSMIVTSKRLFYETGGIFNITVGGKLEADGYGLVSEKQHIADDIDTAINVVGSTIRLDATSRIDLGGIGKGWLIDTLGDWLDAKQLRYVINGGGDIRVSSNSQKALALEHPLDPGLSIGTLTVSSGALAASSPHKRIWKKGDNEHSHIVNTSSRDSDITAAFVFAETTTVADTLATIFLLADTSLRRLLAHQYRAEYLIIRDDGSYLKSPDFPATLN